MSPPEEAERKRRTRLSHHPHAVFIEGTEEQSRRRLGRGLTAEELERILWRYPGDVPERREPDRPA